MRLMLCLNEVQVKFLFYKILRTVSRKLTIFAKSFIVDVRLCSKCTSAFSNKLKHVGKYVGSILNLLMSGLAEAYSEPPVKHLRWSIWEKSSADFISEIFPQNTPS